MFMYCPLGRETGIWAASTEKWDDVYPNWKAVGNSPKRILKSDFCLQDHDYLKKSSIEHIFSNDRFFYLVLFSSGRTCTVSSKTLIKPGTHVIIEADRGEDCAEIKQRIWTSIEDTKLVLRQATPTDIKVLETRRTQEIKAIEKCTQLIQEMELPIVITRCEFQWDMKKITFYFRSDERRVDFRELVKELYKHYRIRIWMSMENRKVI